MQSFRAGALTAGIIPPEISIAKDSISNRLNCQLLKQNKGELFLRKCHFDHKI